jgi:hypothetical protein
MEAQYFGIWFDLGNGKDKIRLPVNPSELTISYEGENTNYNLISIGETVIPRTPKLATVHISSFFPSDRYIAGTVSNVEYDGQIQSARFKPKTYVEFFQRLQRQKKIFQFIVNRYDVDRPMFDTTFEAVVSSFAITDRGGESGDVYFELEISEYRNTAPQSVEIISTDQDSDTTYLATTKQRSVDDNEFVVGDMITVSGPVYETDNQLATAYATSRKHINNFTGTVGRILPPNKRPEFDRLYVTGIGWVQKADCIKGNIDNTLKRLQPEN